MQRIWILPTAKDVLTKPKSFFVKNSPHLQDWKKALLYLSVFSFLVTILMMINNQSFLHTIADYLENTGIIASGSLDFKVGLFGLIIMYIVMSIFLVLSTTLKYWVSHWYTKIFNQKATFKETYAVLTYGGTPGWIASPFFVGAGALFVLATKMSTWLLVPALLLGASYLCLELYGMYIRVIALARVQEIKPIEAVLALYIFGVPTFLIMLFVVEFIIIFLLTLLMVATGLIVF